MDRSLANSIDPRSAAALRILGPIALAAAFVALALRLGGPIGPFDEGLLLANSAFVLDGALPHRDFYTNYPPGIFFAIAGLWKLVGVSVLSERLLGLALHVASAGLAGRLAGRLSGARFSWFAASAVLFWAAGVGAAPRAWLAATVAALSFASLAWSALESHKRATWFAAGLALGAVGCFRHDLFGYVVLVGLAIGVGRAIKARIRPQPAPIASLAAGVLVAAVPVWAPVLLAAGRERVVQDLVVEQARVLAARTLPLWSGSGFRGYQWLFLLELAAPVAAALVLARRGWSNGIAIVGGLALAMLPAAAGRTDGVHVIGCAAPTFVLIAALGHEAFERARSARIRWALAAALVAAVLVPAPHFLSFRLARGETLAAETPRSRGTVESAERRAGREQVLAYVRERTRPKDAIFVGTFRHDVVFANELDLYFLAERRGATRWMQFDPNLTNRADVQTEIVADLERTSAPVVVLCGCCWRDERNGNEVRGSTLLDEYLARRYAVAVEAEPYRVLARIGTPYGVR